MIMSMIGSDWTKPVHPTERNNVKTGGTQEAQVRGKEKGLEMEKVNKVKPGSRRCRE